MYGKKIWRRTLSEHYQQLSFKYFIKPFYIAKLLLKNYIDPDNNF